MCLYTYIQYTKKEKSLVLVITEYLMPHSFLPQTPAHEPVDVTEVMSERQVTPSHFIHPGS